MTATPVVKENGAAPAGFFEVEAAGLRWLAAAGGARCAEVLDVSPGRIVLERIHERRPSADTAWQFGEELARTHDAGADAFGASPAGWEGPLYIGRRQMPTKTSSQWGQFYVDARVRPFLDAAVHEGNLARAERRVVENACDLIANGAFDDEEPPARIHGDLWNGNVLWADQVVLIDPAAHGGHRETDLAMLALFGCPEIECILEGYQSQHPLIAGWQERVPVHQLHPLAVHAAGHGRGYGVELARAARRVLDLI